MSTKRKRTGTSAASKSSTRSDASNHKQPRISQKSGSVKDNTRRRASDEDNDDDDNDDDEEEQVEENENRQDMEQDEQAPISKGQQRKSSSASRKTEMASATEETDTASVSNSSKSSSTPKYSYPINPPPVGRPVRIYCDGIYDLFHFGHAKALEQAKKAFPDVYLLVGVCDDKMTHSRKGKTVMTDKERYESVRHCKWVDEVVESAPWVVDQAFLNKHKIDYVAHDDIPYKSVDSDDVYAFVKNQGCFLPTQRTDGVSTSDLITRIVKDYDQYLRRNLERGVTAKELGIGFFKEQEVKLKKSAQDIRASIRQNWHGTKDELKNEITVLRNDLKQTLNMWEDKSQEFIKDFSRLFGADSVVNKIFRRRRHGNNLITDGSLSSPSNSSSRMASPDSREGSDDEDGSLSPLSRSREFFRFGRGSGSGTSMQRSRSNSSADSYDERSPRSESD
ncbi:choline-phosphate cytidylyltransferase [Mortierella sp. GBA30]|nr:choline-phosphate cytidylyltransferase [Mortierella sp. GBA30]